MSVELKVHSGYIISGYRFEGASLYIDIQKLGGQPRHPTEWKLSSITPAKKHPLITKQLRATCVEIHRLPHVRGGKLKIGGEGSSFLRIDFEPAQADTAWKDVIQVVQRDLD